MEKVRVHVCKNNALYVCSLGLFGGGGGLTGDLVCCFLL